MSKSVIMGYERLAIALNLLAHPHSRHDVCKTPFNRSGFSCARGRMLSPSSRVLITPGRQAERRVGLSVHTFFSFATFNSFVLLNPTFLGLLRI